LRQDRARIQVGRISHFGLLEMSRQRIRASVLESSTEPCPQCGGSGHVRSVSSVALQLLRGLEEILMKGATHDLVVRTRTDVALYVLNHKRGHLRDLENSFKVTLSIIADPTVSGQQSYIIDRGEQVHTLEAAKALLAAQAAAVTPLAKEPFDDEEALDIESESEVETEETEGLADEAAEGETQQEGQRRRRRRRRRGRGSGGGEAREDAAAREEQEGVYAEQGPTSDAQADEGETNEEEAEEQPGMARGDQGNGERRPRRRGRRGGRRRRGGGGDEGLPGSIADELAPPPAFEATTAVADFDGNSSPPSAPEVQPESIAPTSEPQPAEHPAQEMASASAVAQETEKPAPRRSTVREKVSFFAEAQQEGAAAEPAPAASEIHADPAPAQVLPPSPETAAEAPPPRRAGWWSRRFGSSE
jgi:ribonuclease E